MASLPRLFTLKFSNPEAVPLYLITNRVPWSKGYFEFLEHHDLGAMDRLRQHSFRDSRGFLFDEQGSRLTRCRQSGNGASRAIAPSTTRSPRLLEYRWRSPEGSRPSVARDLRCARARSASRPEVSNQGSVKQSNQCRITGLTLRWSLLVVQENKRVGLAFQKKKFFSFSW